MLMKTMEYNENTWEHKYVYEYDIYPVGTFMCIFERDTKLRESVKTFKF